MPDENYALEAATRLNEIGFAEFTSDLISKTFEAIIDANLKQTESYIDLVKEMTKSLSTYINDTKLEISNQEVLDHLSSLPAFVDGQGVPILNQTQNPPTAPVALLPGEELKPDVLTAVNKTFTSGQLAATILQAAGNPAITTLVKDSLGMIGKLVSPSNAQVFPVSTHPDYYDPEQFKNYLSTNPQTANAKLDDAAIAKLYDSVAEVIAGDKYALLQEMVKLGVLRLVVTDGVIRTSLTFSSFERSSKNTSSYDHHKESVSEKYKHRQAPSRGILKLIRNRPLEKSKKKERDVHVTTVTEQTSTAQGTNITIFGGVEIRFKTDYLPVAQA